MPETNKEPRLEAPAPRPRKYAFFRFQTGKRLASAYGCCSGQVDRRTGEILATITYGLFQYRETFKLNLSDPVHSFPYTIDDEIICVARKAVRLGGPMTRRRVVFVRKDGRRYITEEFNGDKSECAACGGLPGQLRLGLARDPCAFHSSRYLFEVHKDQSEGTGGLPLFPG